MIRTLSRLMLLLTGSLLTVGCGASTTPDAPTTTGPAGQTTASDPAGGDPAAGSRGELRTATLYLAGMNQRLKIL